MPAFNPHDNKTANGRIIVIGMRVLDYDRRHGTVVGDTTSPTMCEQGYCDADHWFAVQPDEDGVSERMFNGERLQAI